VILFGPFDQDLTVPGEEGRSYSGARVSDESPARLRPGSGRRRRSGRFWTTAMTRRCSARREELDGDDNRLDCFQKKGMRSAGDVQGGRSFGLMKRSSICCEINQTKDVRGGTGARGRE
jgi:hypothetical protein